MGAIRTYMASGPLLPPAMRARIEAWLQPPPPATAAALDKDDSMADSETASPARPTATLPRWWQTSALPDALAAPPAAIVAGACMPMNHARCCIRFGH